MQAQATPLDGTKAIGITFTDKPLTTFGGLALFVAFAQPIGLATKLAEVLPFVQTSPNATPPHHIVLAFLANLQQLLPTSVNRNAVPVMEANV